MVVKCIVHMHITAEVKAYWLLVKLYLYLLASARGNKRRVLTLIH